MDFIFWPIKQRLEDATCLCLKYDSHVHLPFSDELVNEKEKYKGITDELDQTFSELASY